MVYKRLGILLMVCNVALAWQVLGSLAKEKEKWVEPNAWAREVDSLVLENSFCTCNAEGNANDVSGTNQAASLILKKFIRQLFSRDKLQYDKEYLLYQRNLLFTILPAQLEKLEQLDDPRDLDDVLTEIFQNVRTPNDYNNNSGSWTRIFALIWDILKDCVLLLRFSEVRFITFVIAIIMAGWFIHRKHNISIIVMILSGFFLFGYFHTYLECNRELEMKQMVEAIEHIEVKPQPYEPRWYSPITNWFGSSPEEVVKKERREKIKKESRLNLSFCRPDHVLIMYMNDIFLKQLEFLIEKCTVTIAKVKENLGFPYNYMAVACLLSLIVMLIKLTFEHVLSPRVWTGYFQRNETYAPSPRHQQALPENNEDRLSGENLKILLKAISMPTTSSVTITPAISSVQEVLEPLEAPGSSQNDNLNSSGSTCTSCGSCSEADISAIPTTISAFVNEVALAQNNISNKTENPADADFVIVSEVKSKVLLEDLINDHD